MSINMKVEYCKHCKTYTFQEIYTDYFYCTACGNINRPEDNNK